MFKPNHWIKWGIVIKRKEAILNSTPRQETWHYSNNSKDLSTNASQTSIAISVADDT